MDMEALGQRIAQVLKRENIDMAACEQSMGDYMMSRRLIKAFQEGGIAKLEEHQDLCEWAEQEVKENAQCFSFKLWLAANA